MNTAARRAPIGIKAAAAVTVLLGLLAMAASVRLALDEYQDFSIRASYAEETGLIEAPFAFGIALVIASAGLVKSQNWARILVALGAPLVAVGLCLLSVLAVGFAPEAATRLLVPALALPGCLACLWLVFHLSVGPGRSHFPAVFSPSSKRGCAWAIALVVAGPGVLLSWTVTRALLEVAVGVATSSPASPSPPPPADIAARLGRVLARVPGPEGAVAQRCPDSEIVKTSPEFEKATSYFGPVAFVWPVLHDAKARPWEPEPGWEWWTHPSIRRLPQAHDYDLRPMGTLRYLAVLRSEEKSLPQALSQGEPIGGNRRKLVAGTHYRPGTFRGALFIMDIERAVVVCQAPLDVRSSAQLEYSTEGTMARSAQEALTTDFRERFVERTRSAAHGISRVVRVSLVLGWD